MNKKAENLTARNDALDIIKAFSIILVVVGHSIQYGSGADFLSEKLYFENICFKVIYSFHMPLYMLISGYLFAYSIKKRTWHENIYNKIKSLIIPIALWSMIPFIISITHINYFSAGNLIKGYISTTIFNLWFLWAVFWCSALVIIVNRFFHDSFGIYLLGFVLTFLVPDSYNLKMYKFMYPFFLLGYFFNKHNWNMRLEKFYSRKLFKIGLAVLYIFLLLFYQRDSYIYTSGYYILNKKVPFIQLGIDIYRFSIGLVGSLLVLIILFTAEKYMAGKTRNILIYIGKNTFGIYIISSLIFSYILPNVTYNLMGINYVYVIIETFIIILFCIVCIKIIHSNNHLSGLLFGNRG